MSCFEVKQVSNLSSTSIVTNVHLNISKREIVSDAVSCVFLEKTIRSYLENVNNTTVYNGGGGLDLIKTKV